MHEKPKIEDSSANLKGVVLDALRRFPLGLSEYELLKFLQAAGHIQFERIALLDNLSLFQTHFVLFHTLYTLREELWQEDKQVLDISPLKIVLYSFDKKDFDEKDFDETGVDEEGDSANTDILNAGLTEHDPLRDYYLDINNLEQTTGDEVTRLLDSFWTRLEANDQRVAALEVLELTEPVDYTTIKQQYRRLAMQHHPDRGGDKVQLQTLNVAMAVLEKCYKI